MDELYINNVKADLTGETISLNYKNNLLGEIGALQSSFSYTIALPKTARNCSIFKMAHIPNVRTINGTKVIGETLQVKYLKDGINILGDAVGYLDRISEDAFEITLSFGFLGKFSKWIEEGKTLNDFDYYNDANALTITYDNELTDYPESIDDLPNIFNPYYNPGVEMDEQAKKQIARLPAVRVPYYIEQIENETKCKFVFPENVAEKLKYLAIPLISKKQFFEQVNFEYATLIDGNYIKTADGMVAEPSAVDGKTVAPITFKNFHPSKIDESFKKETYKVRARTLHRYSGYAKYSDTLSMTVIIPNSQIKIPGKNIYGISLNSANIYILMPFKIIGDYEKETDENGYAVLPHSNCTIKLHKLKQNEIDNVWESIDVVYSAGGKVTLLTSSIASAFVDSGIFSIDFENGFAYGFTIEMRIYNETGLINKEYSYNEISPVESGEFAGGFTFEPNIKGVGDYNLLPSEDNIPAKGNLPDISQVDFLQTLCDMFGVFPIINPRPRQDDETGRDIVEFVNIETLNANKTIIYRNGMPVNDWTNRLVSPPEGIAISVKKENYFRRNYFKYAEDDTVENSGDGYFDIDDKTLEKEGNLVELKFAPADGDTIKMYTVEYDENKNRTYTFESPTPRITHVTSVSIDGTTKIGITFDGLSFGGDTGLIKNYYSQYISVVKGWYILTVSVTLSTLDLANLDFTLPVYLKQFGRWFGVVSIQSGSSTDNCEVELLLL